MKRLYISLLAFSALFKVSAQCSLNALSSDETITCGDCASLSAFGNGSGNVAFQEDFNSGSPVGWGFTQAVTIGTNTCGVPSPDGSPFMWMGDASVNPRDMQTVAFDLTLGGTICFEMRYSNQGDASPCEGPDEPDEGVYLQYSTNGGATWQTIQYFDPNGGNDPNLTGWNQYCAILPPGALTANTMIRWHQDAVSGAEYDHWGIDNVVITLNDPTFTITWQHDSYSYGIGNGGGINPTPVCPITTTTYTAVISNGTTSCNATVTVTVVPPDIFVNAGVDANVCPGDCINLAGEAYEIVLPAQTPTFENNEVGVSIVTPQSPFALPCTNFGGCACPGGGSVGLGGTCPPTPGTINSTINLSVDNLNNPTLGTVDITSVCIGGFTFGPGCSGLSLANVEIVLKHPNGTELILAPTGSLSGSSLLNMCFELGGSAISSGAGASYNGTFNPANSWAAWNGLPSEGVFQLIIRGSNPNLCIAPLFFTSFSMSFDDPQVVAPVTFTWSPTAGMTNATTLTPNVCPVATTTYTLSATDLSVCATEMDQVTITVGACCALDITNATLTQPSCGSSNGAATIVFTGAIAGLSFSIDGGVTTQASPIFSGLAAGSYTVQATDNSACVETFNFTLVAGSGPTISAVAVTNASCGNNDGTANATASGGTGTLSYSIDLGTSFQTPTNFTNLAQGTYSMIVNDAAGCSDTASFIINNTNGPSITTTAVTPASCGSNDGSATTTAVGASLYSLDGGITTQASNVFSGLAAGTYTITVEDALGCQAAANFTILGGTGPVITSSTPTDATCGANDGEIDIVATNATEYSIDSGLSTQVSPNFAGLSAGNYTLIASDGTCADTSIVTILNANGPTIDLITFTDPSCGTSNGSIVITATGGTGALQFSNNNGTSFQAGNTFTSLAGGTYNIVVEDASGCQASVNSILTSSDAPEINSLSIVQPSCGASDGSITINASVTSGTMIFSIDNGTTTQAGNVFTGLSSGTYDIVVRVGTVCVADTSITLTNTAGPIVNAGVNQNVCVGQSVTLSATSAVGNGISWNNGILEDTPFSANTTTTYTVTATDPNGCIATDDVLVTVNVGPILTVVPSVSSGCAPLTVTFTNTTAGASNCLWDFTPGNSVNGCGSQTITFNQAGCVDLSFTASNALGCSTTTNFNDIVCVFGQPIANFTANPPVLTTADPSVTFLNASSGASIYSWAFGDGETSILEDPSHTYENEPGNYLVTLIAANANGCTDTARVLMSIAEELIYFIPNTFTPDGDELNQSFQPIFTSGFDPYDFEMLIFDRWGEIIFETKNDKIGWDGTYRGEFVKDGTYVYQIEFKTKPTDARSRVVGHVNVLR